MATLDSTSSGQTESKPQTPDLQTIVAELLRQLQVSAQATDKSSIAQATGANQADSKPIDPSHEVSFLTIDQFRDRNFSLTDPHAAVDVVLRSQLRDEPQIKVRDNGEVVPAASDKVFGDVMLIQINSTALISVLNLFLKTEEKFSITNKAWLHLTPFKTLVSIQDKLHVHLNDLRQRFSNTQASDDQSSQGKPTDNGPRSRNAYLDLQCLLCFFDNTIQPWLSANRGTGSIEVSFDELSTLYRPGDIVVSDGPQSMYRVSAVHGGYHRTIPMLRSSIADPETGTAGQSSAVVHLEDWTDLVLECYYIKHNGRTFLEHFKRFTIRPFHGRRHCRLLRPYPLRFAVAKTCEDRWAEDLRFYNMTDSKEKPKFWKYIGRTLTEDFNGGPLIDNGHFASLRLAQDPLPAQDLDTDVVIDLNAALMSRPGWNGDDLQDFYLTMAKDNEQEPEKEDDVTLLAGILSPNVSIQSPRTLAEQHEKAYLQSDPWTNELAHEDAVDRERRQLFKANAGDEESRQGLNDSILLLPSRVFGYILRERKWTCFDLSDRATWSLVEKDDTPWNEMQIRESHRRNLIACIDRHFRSADRRRADITYIDGFDVIQGKGRGLIILLHGAPGVGKTATAESIARRFGKPLLPITCGDLGTDVYQVEAILKDHLDLAERWGCIVLLDEADVFLARREKNDIKRNALVSIFLNMLEYYSGVLFLTTNRTGDFDEAFTSRIHLSLWYPDFNSETTRNIWANNLKRLTQQEKGRDGGIVVEDDGATILKYAEKHCQAYEILQLSPWNGRQIRNAFQTAVALAEHEARKNHGGDVPPSTVLSWTHFRTVAVAVNHFDGYLTETRGKNAEQAAKDHALRAKFNAYAATGGDEPPKAKTNAKYRKITLHRAHNFLKSISPDTVVEAPEDLFKADVDDTPSLSTTVQNAQRHAFGTFYQDQQTHQQPHQQPHAQPSDAHMAGMAATPPAMYTQNLAQMGLPLTPNFGMRQQQFGQPQQMFTSYKMPQYPYQQPGMQMDNGINSHYGAQQWQAPQHPGTSPGPPPDV